MYQRSYYNDGQRFHEYMRTPRPLDSLKQPHIEECLLYKALAMAVDPDGVREEIRFNREFQLRLAVEHIMER